MSNNFGYGLLAGSGMASESAGERNASVAHSLDLIKSRDAISATNAEKAAIFQEMVSGGKVGAPTHTFFSGGAAWIFDGSIYWLDADGMNCLDESYDYNLIEGYTP